MSRELETGLMSLRFSRRMALALLDGIPREHRLHVPVTDGNHATWIAGHLAWEDDDILSHLVPGRGSKLAESWHGRFAQGSRPGGDAAAYPAYDEIRAALDRFRAELIGYLSDSVDRLGNPLPDGIHAFAKDLGALMPALACHEMIHVGQLTVIRKSLRLPPVFG
ncbi:MAG: DinB family protein [Phycisphaerales bacterium]|nr:DinB family protein [Phycisphaerales bacterium]